MNVHDPAAVAFSYTAADFIAAQRLHATPSRRLMLIIAVAIAGFLALSFWLTDDGIAPLMGVAAGFVATPIMWFAVIPWAARRNFVRLPKSELSFRFTLLPDGLQQTSARGTSMLRWGDFRRWRTNREVTLLYTSRQHFLVVPARLQADGFDREQLIAALTQAIGQRATGLISTNARS